MAESLVKYLLPDFRFQKLTDIDDSFFMGAQLIIFDVDNTLVLPETKEIKEEIINWFSRIKNRYSCILISNSRTIFKRAEEISKILECEVFLSRYKKPSRKLFKEIKEKYKLSNRKVFVVGDRILTDILFGNLSGAITVLIAPFTNQESLIIKTERYIEKFLLFLINALGYNK